MQKLWIGRSRQKKALESNVSRKSLINGRRGCAQRSHMPAPLWPLQYVIPVNKTLTHSNINWNLSSTTISSSESLNHRLNCLINQLNAKLESNLIAKTDAVTLVRWCNQFRSKCRRYELRLLRKLTNHICKHIKLYSSTQYTSRIFNALNFISSSIINAQEKANFAR